MTKTAKIEVPRYALYQYGFEVLDWSLAKIAKHFGVSNSTVWAAMFRTDRNKITTWKKQPADVQKAAALHFKAVKTVKASKKAA
jgi:hypothetical protein